MHILQLGLQQGILSLHIIGMAIGSRCKGLCPVTPLLLNCQLLGDADHWDGQTGRRLLGVR